MFRFPAGKKINLLVFPKTSTLVLGPTQLSV